MNYTKNSIDDYRDLKGYYTILFSNMESVSQYVFNRDFEKMTNAIRELVINTSPYIDKPDKDLEEIENRYEKVYKYIFNKFENKKKINESNIEKDNYIKFIRLLRIKIYKSLSKAGVLPKTFDNYGIPGVARAR